MKKTLFFTVIFALGFSAAIAQNNSQGGLYGARTAANSNQPQAPVVEKVQPNPVTDGMMDIAEGFDDITTLPGNGWALINMSNPLGLTDWFQGNAGVFPAYDGAADAYIGANFNNTTGSGTISNWLITPEQTIQNGDQMSFYTRTAAGSVWPDRLEVRLSLNGASTDVGTSEISVGDFTILLLTINPVLIIGGYPESWTQFSVTVTGLSGTESGRFALRYFVENGGPSGDNSNYIGIDRVSFAETVVVPISNWAIAIGIALIFTFIVIRYRRLV